MSMALCAQDIGSYFTRLFTSRLRKNVERKENKGLAEVLEGVQEDLHIHGKQLPVIHTNNQTRTMRFEVKATAGGL